MLFPRTLVTPAAALLASLIATPTLAQLHTDCNPTLKDCPADPAFGTAHTFYFNSTPSADLWNTSAGTITYDAENGATFTISKKGYSPTLTTNFYFFWGRTEVIMKAANGTGIISSIVYGSDDLDEVDWEFRGVDTNVAQSNFYGKGNVNSSVGANHAISGNSQTEWHNYTNVWTKDKLEWWIDGTLARTLTPAMANDTWYPQTPMKLMLGIWAGGDSSQSTGTIEWAGGATDYDAGPYTMYVKSAHIEDYSSGKEYVYGDKTGDYTSIKITQPDSNSTAVDNLNKSTTAEDEDESISEKWAALSSGTKTGIYVGAAGVVAVMFLALLFYYLKQRKRGKEEAALAAQNQERERLELEQFKKEGRDPDALGYAGVDYDASSMRKDGYVSTAAYNIPDSRSNSLRSLHQMPEKTSGWDPTNAGAASNGMRSPMPLLNDGPQSPHVGSPGPQNFSGPLRNNSFSPVRTQSPGFPMGSPGPQMGGYGGPMDRMGSPGPGNQGGYGNGGGNGYYNGNGGYR